MRVRWPPAQEANDSPTRSESARSTKKTWKIFNRIWMSIGFKNCSMKFWLGCLMRGHRMLSIASVSILSPCRSSRRLIHIPRESTSSKMPRVNVKLILIRMISNLSSTPMTFSASNPFQSSTSARPWKSAALRTLKKCCTSVTKNWWRTSMSTRSPSSSFFKKNTIDLATATSQWSDYNDVVGAMAMILARFIYGLSHVFIHPNLHSK